MPIVSRAFNTQPISALEAADTRHKRTCIRTLARAKNNPPFIFGGDCDAGPQRRTTAMDTVTLADP